MSSQVNVRFFGATDQGARAVSAPARARDEDPKGYVASKALTDAVNAAILLGQPLLLTGEPGVGKTSVGRAIADQLGLPLLEFTVKSTSRAVDLFYEYDAVGRFHAAEAERASAARFEALKKLAPETLEEVKRSARSDQRLDLLNYIRVRALGRAILNALPGKDCYPFVAMPEEHRIGGQRYKRDTTPGRWVEEMWEGPEMQSVVIIDEIDKAPSDFCNDLLDELEMMRFQVPEFAVIPDMGDAPRFGGELHPGLRPIVIITSNQERPLPDAFLRRCCYHHIDMPSGDALTAVIESRLGDNARIGRDTLKHALDTFGEIKKLPLAKKPGLAELLGWLRYIAFHRKEATGAYHIGKDAEFLGQSLATLIKDPVDLKKAQAWLKTYNPR
jgi:MoxR-like ATPase